MELFNEIVLVPFLLGLLHSLYTILTVSIETLMQEDGQTNTVQNDDDSIIKQYEHFEIILNLQCYKSLLTILSTFDAINS